jgi:hypothetical protein
VVAGVPRFADAPARLWWTDAPQWSNSEDDDALLYDCRGTLVSRFDDGA